jgi:hypothetical protein
LHELIPVMSDIPGGQMISQIEAASGSINRLELVN